VEPQAAQEDVATNDSVTVDVDTKEYGGRQLLGYKTITSTRVLVEDKLIIILIERR